MERGATVKRHWLSALLLLSFPLCALPAWSADALVLVVRADSPIQSLDSLQIRKAFVGLTVTADGGTVRPLINDSLPMLRTAFLQHIVGLSEQMYQRRTLTLALQQGRALPPAFTSQTELLRELAASPYAVTYMWLSMAQTSSQLRVVRVLWRN
jgi:hypothetical protein